MIGRRIGAYHIESAHGRGGMGSVFRAGRADGNIGQKVAIKVIRPDRLSAVDWIGWRDQFTRLCSRSTTFLIVDSNGLVPGSNWSVGVINAVFTWLLVASILVMQAVRVVLVLRLRERYPEIYQNLGMPSSVGRMHSFVFELARRKEFRAMSKSDRAITHVLRCLFVLPFVFAFMALITLRAG